MARDFAKAFYKSREWQEVRELIRKRDRYLCKHCGQYGEEVHHIIHLTPENIWDEKITLNPSNLELLCRECHKKEHKRDRANGHIKDTGKAELSKSLDNEYIFDANGRLVKR